MTTRQRRWLRGTAVVVWLVLALITVGPALAQDGGTVADPTQPQTLNEVAARLAPLLVGAALIERTLEFLFSWAQRAILDATSTMRSLAKRIMGLMEGDFRPMWNRVQMLNKIMAQRAQGGMAAEDGDPTSPDPVEWPLANLEAQLAEAQKQLIDTEARLKLVLESDLYKQRKKMVAGILSIIMGVSLALMTSTKLFESLDVRVTGWFERPFRVIDMILAGVLMGLGTDWVHQVLSILTKSQSFLGKRADATVTVDTEGVRAQAEAAFQMEFAAELRRLRAEAEQQMSVAVEEVRRGGGTPPA
ncbi:MAG: hypothetical protein HY866_20875 [Chloroflexi bacterium]|nr:hypothetical protein [Chloroflexota bacterium]